MELYYQRHRINLTRNETLDSTSHHQRHRPVTRLAVLVVDFFFLGCPSSDSDLLFLPSFESFDPKTLIGIFLTDFGLVLFWHVSLYVTTTSGGLLSIELMLMCIVLGASESDGDPISS